MTVPVTSVTQPGNYVYSMMYGFSKVSDRVEKIKCHALSLQAETEEKVEVLEEVTADTENLGAVEVTVSVGVLVTTNDDVAGNETVSYYSSNLLCLYPELTFKLTT